MADSVSIISSQASGVQIAAVAAAQSQLASDKARSAQTSPAGTAQPGPTSSTASSSTAASGPVPADQLAAAVKHLQDYFQPDQNVTMQVDHATGESYVKIVDAKTKQLVLQIPSKEVLAMAQKLREMAYPQSASGVLVDHQG